MSNQVTTATIGRCAATLALELEANLGFRNYIQLQFLVHQTGPSLRQVALVGHYATPAKAAWEEQLVQPLGPLRVEVTIWLLILGLEHTHFLLDN